MRDLLLAMEDSEFYMVRAYADAGQPMTPCFRSVGRDVCLTFTVQLLAGVAMTALSLGHQR